MAIQSENITLRDGRIICAPADPKLMTNYILKEQGEWFEDEIDFVKALIEPGMNVLDIGANYGLYSSVIARALQGSGKLWCFEPTPDTASCLRSTVELNEIGGVVEVLELGLSEEPGEATFFLADNAELNSLTRTSVTQREITIALDRLDSVASDQQIMDVVFVKLDAEGEEIKILKGASEFFSQNHPLVMFELKHGDQVNVKLIDEFEAMGMTVYRLVPSLQILVPFDKSQEPDGFLLNLFAGDDECQKRLSERGLLVTQSQVEEAQLPVDRPMPESMYAADMTLKTGDYYEKMLSCHALSQASDVVPAVKYRALQTAVNLIVEKLGNDVETRPERLSSMARVLFDAGNRSLGNAALNVIIDNYVVKGVPFQIEEPFLKLEPETFSEEGKDRRLVMAANVVESWLKKHAYSTFFSSPKTTRMFIEFQQKIGMLSDYTNTVSALLPTDIDH